MKKNRTLIVAIAVVVVAGIAGYAVMSGMYPPKTGTEGAIGAASRYQAQQISDSDVSLTDPSVQAFLQSDTFHKIATNPVFRKEVVAQAKEIVKFYEKTKLADGADVAELLDGAEVAELMNDAELLNVAANDELFKKALKNKKLVEFANEVLAERKAKGSNNEATAAELAKASEVLQEAGVTSDLQEKSKLVYNQAFAEMMSKGHAAELLDNGDLLELMSNDGIGEVFKQGSIQTELLEASTVEAMKKASPEVLRSATATVHPRKNQSQVNP